MKESDLKERTKSFALRIINLYVALPKTTEAQVLGKQILRSETLVGAQYRECCRAKSNPDFIRKLEGALPEELDKNCCRLKLICEAEILKWNAFLLCAKKLRNLSKFSSQSSNK